MDLVFDNENRYGRTNFPLYSMLCKKLSTRYNATAYVTSSGMNAISTLFRVLLDFSSAPYHLVYADELYCDLDRLFKYFSYSNKLNLYPVNITDTTKIQSLLTSLKDKPVILYFETCSNPHGMIFEFDLIKSLKAENKDLVVIVDNTWVTSAVFNPLDSGADFVVSSLTKYYSNSKSLGGVIVSRDPFIAEIEKYIRFHGLHVSPHNCKVIVNNIDAVEERMRKAYTVMLELFKLLSTDTRFKDIVHPLIETHGSHAQYVKYFTSGLGPNVFTMRIKGNAKSIKRMRDNFQHIKYKTSFGSSETRYDPWYKGTGEGYTYCRIAVGYDSNAQDLYNDLIR